MARGPLGCSSVRTPARPSGAGGELGACPFVAIELGLECLGVHTGEARGQEGSNAVGFARFRLGRADPTPLVELVRQPATRPSAIEAARAAFESAGLKVAVCGDFPGRIVDRLIRPYLNCGAAQARRETRKRRRPRQDPVPRSGLPRRPDLASGTYGPCRTPRRHPGAVSRARAGTLCAGPASSGCEATGRSLTCRCPRAS